MPVTVEIDAAAKLVLSTFTGAIGEADVLYVGAQLMEKREFNPWFSHIIDFSGITNADVSTNFIKGFAREKPLFHRYAQQIIVAPQAHIFGLARMVQILREEQLPNIQVVRTLHEAYGILGIEPRG